MSESLENLSNQMIPAVEAEMRDIFQLRDSSSDLFYSMMHYHMGWVDEDLSPLEVKSGKRVRPLLCLLSCAAAGGDWRQAIPAAASIEIIHNFSLVHDDIQDESPTRRGRKTLWQIWGSSQAINTGDAMFALAHSAMERLQTHGVSDSITLQAMRMLDNTCVALTKGQFSDMSFEERDDVSVDQYMNMINGKTAALLSLSTELGALISGSGKSIVDHYRSFGSDLGLAFQIRDDILGIWGDETVIGKSAATDIETRKKSLPVLHGLSKDETLRQLYFVEEQSDDFVDKVVAILDSTGSRAFSEEYEKKYANSAIAHLEAVSPEGYSGQALYQITIRLLQRQF